MCQNLLLTNLQFYVIILSMKTQTCKKCQGLKPATTEFFYAHHTKSGLDGTCKVCRLARMKELHDTDEYRAHRLVYWKDWRNKNIIARRKQERARERKLLYNLSPEQYGALDREQNHCCAICKAPFETSTPHADHSHKTGQPRGLLCRYCNSVLGHAKENIQTLERAIEYLRKYSEPK